MHRLPPEGHTGHAATVGAWEAGGQETRVGGSLSPPTLSHAFQIMNHVTVDPIYKIKIFKAEIHEN